MAINFKNYGLQDFHRPDYSSIADVFPNILEGYKAARAPEIMDADIAKKRAEAQRATMGGDFTGTLGNMIRLNQLKQNPNADPQLIKQLEGQLGLERQREQGILDWQKANMEALPTRLLTTQGRQQNELLELKKGYKLGSSIGGKPEKLSPEDAAFQISQYEMGMLKDITDPEQLRRVRASSDVHTTLGMINPKDAFRYSGTWGKLAEKAQKGISSLTGEESEQYASFEENATKMQLLSKQLSNFFGSGAAQGIQEGIAFIANPNSWLYSPKVAERKFKTLVDIFEAESAQQRAFLRNAEMYGAESPRNENDIRNEGMQQAITQSQNAIQPSAQSSGQFDPNLIRSKWEARRKR